MKITALQIKALQDYLHETLVYREAYEEIYDHILTALEHQPDNMTYQDAINNIIRNDFGDPKNLLKVERGIKEALVNEAVGKFLVYLRSYFLFPAIFYTIMGALVSYYCFSNSAFGPDVILWIFALLVSAPAVIWLLRLYNTGYILDTTRKSAKDKLFENFTGLPIRVGIIPMVFVSLSNYKLWQDNNYYFITLFFIMGVLYNLALYQLYRDEFISAPAK